MLKSKATIFIFSLIVLAQCSALFHKHNKHHENHEHHHKQAADTRDSRSISENFPSHDDSNATQGSDANAVAVAVAGADGAGDADADDDAFHFHDDENEADEFCEWYKCDKDLRKPRGLSKYVDFRFLRKFARNLIPFLRQCMEMNFYLFKRDFPECGRELSTEDTKQEILNSGFNPKQGTRIIIHGWMSQSRGSFNRDVKNAYLNRSDYNVIIADWSTSATNLNYFAVVKMIEEFGAQLARFTQHLHTTVGVSYDDIYLIGHSLGAQIAGAAGKLIKPEQYNTIFALDPAGPKFRHRTAEFRIDPTDAKYVESIQTSGNLGFLEPTGNATFYPNYGLYQKSCYYLGCSHIRAYKMFAESLTTQLGFWGPRCKREKEKLQCNKENAAATGDDKYRMGGEPAQVKSGVFFVKTAAGEPFALGRGA